MENISNRFVLVAAACLAILAVIGFYYAPAALADHVPLVAKLALTVAFLMGVSLFTYAYPVSGTTPPTVAQTGPNGFNTVIGTAFFADADTTLTITHNWGFTSAQAAQFLPEVHAVTQVSGTAPPLFIWNWGNTNAIVMSKAAGAGTGGTFTVYLHRPNTLTL